MSRETGVSLLVMGVVVLALTSALMPKAKFDYLKAKLYRLLYDAAAILMTIGFVGAFVSFAAECVYWLRFGAWPSWSILTGPIPATGFVGSDRILHGLSNGPPSIQLGYFAFVCLLVAMWFEWLSNNADKKAR